MHTRIHVRYSAEEQPAQLNEYVLPLPRNQNEHMINVVKLCRVAAQHPETQFVLNPSLSLIPSQGNRPTLDCEVHWYSCFVPTNVIRPLSWSREVVEEFDPAPAGNAFLELFSPRRQMQLQYG